MKNIICFLFFLVFIFKSNAQYIEGKVLDAETKLPIEDVQVYMDNLEQGTLTNYKGNYYLKFPFKKVENSIIHFSHIGYKKLSIPFNTNKNDYSVYLIPTVNQLSEVEILERNKLNAFLNYTQLATMKNGVLAYGAVLENNKIYVVGGNNSFEIDGPKRALEKYEDTNLSLVEIMLKAQGSYEITAYNGDFLIYNIDLDTWEINEAKFLERANHNLHFYNNNLYVLGGTMLSKNRKFEYLNDKIEVYNLKKDTIVEDRTNPHQAVNFASFTYQDNIIVMGGSIKLKRNGFKEYSNKAHLYNIPSGYWYEIDSMPSKKEVNGILVQDKIYLIGGYAGKELSEIESYNLITKEWKKEGDLFFGISKPAITAHNNIIYIFNEGKIITYNLILNELNEYFIDLTMSNSSMFYANDKLYILGGLKETTYSKTPSAGLFSIDINAFENTRISKSKKL